LGPEHLPRLAACAALAICLAGVEASAQAIPASNGRFSLFADWSDRTPTAGESVSFSEVIATLSLYPGRGSDSSFEYRLDTRVATYPNTDSRDQRFSVYEAWVGLRSPEGTWKLRLGQMWLHDLGGLGQVGGLLGEYSPRGSNFRFGLFGGLEPKILEAGWVDSVTKGGAYVALDAAHGRRHVLGWVLLRNHDLTERSVVVLNNFIPINHTFFAYQALEYDLQGPAGLGNAGLTYFFANLRYRPVDLIEVQGTYHRGRSIDARAISQDVLDGRPVNPELLDGLLFESERIRLSVLPVHGVRVWAGWGRDKNNRDEQWSDRLSYGVYLNDLVGSGLDLVASNQEIDRGDSRYNSIYASLGRTIGRRVYLSLDYITSLSVFSYGDGHGGVVEVRPKSERYSLSLDANLSRRLSLLLVGEWTDSDAYQERRVLAGLAYRF
jgi:hypothetical protein